MILFLNNYLNVLFQTVAQRFILKAIGPVVLQSHLYQSVIFTYVLFVNIQSLTLGALDAISPSMQTASRRTKDVNSMELPTL